VSRVARGVLDVLREPAAALLGEFAAQVPHPKQLTPVFGLAQRGEPRRSFVRSGAGAHPEGRGHVARTVLQFDHEHVLVVRRVLSSGENDPDHVLTLGRSRSGSDNRPNSASRHPRLDRQRMPNANSQNPGDSVSLPSPNSPTCGGRPQTRGLDGRPNHARPVAARLIGKRDPTHK
jgi:hypothetical protein